MAVRFDASADRLLRTTDLIDYNSAYTVMFWFYFVSDMNAQTSLFSLNINTATTNDTIRTDTDGTTLRMVAAQGPGNNLVISGTNISTGTWYHGAMVRESATQLNFYLNGNLDISINWSVAGRTSPATRMEVGGRHTADIERFDGRMAAIKAWSAGLTQDQVKAEMWSYLPRYLTSLYGFWPCFGGSSERLKDYGSVLRNWTESGTLSDEAGPPIVWGASSPFIIFSPATAGIPVVSSDFYSPLFGRMVVRR